MSQRTDDQWLLDLKSPPAISDSAIHELRQELMKRLTHAFAGRPAVDRGFVEDHVQEATVRVLDRLDTFRGESRFLTWATKIAVRLVLSELRRRRWRDVSLDSFPDLASFFAAEGPGPETNAVRRQLMDMVRDTIFSELTEKQRRTVVAIHFEGMPLEEVARKMGTNRNSLYKLMHDARLRLKTALSCKGVTVNELMEVFE